jgi:hypothetical protein
MSLVLKLLVCVLEKLPTQLRHTYIIGTLFLIKKSFPNLALQLYVH